MRKLFAVLMSLCLVLSFCVCAFATEGSSVQSPTDKPVNSVEFISYDTDKPNSTEYTVVVGETIEITAPDSEDSEFNGFTIEGEYEIISGGLDNQTIVIRPLSDIIIIANYNNTPSVPSTSGDNGNDSPQTGADPMIFVIAVAVVAAIVGITLATKKLRGKKN